MKFSFFQTTFFLLLFFSSCKVSRENIVGTYYLKASPKTKLVLKEDKTFSFVKNLSKPRIDVFNDPDDLNFRTTGNWHLNQNKKLVLNSFTDHSINHPTGLLDTVSPNTSIISFSFWDQYGDPVPIHFLKFLPDRMKFHLNNSISFFPEDFNKIDTMGFYFNGYPPYMWSEKFMDKKQGSNYKITLYEETRPGFFKDVTFIVKRKKLTSANKQFSLKKIL